MMSMDPEQFIPSGNNDHYIGDKANFAEYQTAMQAIVTASRIDLNSPRKNEIIRDNSPYTWTAKNPNQHGVLLIHGLYDSPYSLMDIAKRLTQQGFLTRGLLLAGHGTRPGDLLNATSQDWLNATEFAIKCMQQDCQSFSIIGFSLGGAIASMMLLNHPDIKSGVFIAPAFKTNIPWAGVVDWHHYFSWLSDDTKWYRQRPANCFTKYTSFPFNAAHQARKLMQLSNIRVNETTINQPVMVIATDTDESVSTTNIIDWFTQTKQSHNRLLLYSQNYRSNDPRIIQRTSHYPEQHILDFSHSCLTFPPENPYFGINGEYKDFNHYPEYPPYELPRKLGSISRHNVMNYCLQRLNYNPDFEFMSSSILEFLHEART